MQNKREKDLWFSQKRKKEEKRVKKLPLSTDFSPPPLLLMASSSSNPSPGLAMASGGDSENPMADVEAVGDIDGKSTDPSRFSPVPEDDRESFVFPFFDLWYDNGGNFPYVPSKVSPPPPD